MPDSFRMADTIGGMENPFATHTSNTAFFLVAISTMCYMESGLWVHMDTVDLKNLESKGINTVMAEIAQGVYGHPGSHRRSDVEAWIRFNRAASEHETSSKRDAREEEMLSIARAAARRADRANLIAWIAAIITTASIIKDIVMWIMGALR